MSISVSLVFLLSSLWPCQFDAGNTTDDDGLHITGLLGDFFIRGIAMPSVGIIRLLDERQIGKNVWGRKMKPRELPRRSLRRRFFALRVFCLSLGCGGGPQLDVAG